MRIAFVGVGPKGLYCLECLAIEMIRRPCRIPLAINLFEPHGHPGAGPVYDPQQPEFLRMNFASRHVDAWSRPADDGLRLPFDRPTLVEWLEDRYPEYTDPEGYAPRAVVGEYLHSVFDQVFSWLRQNASVRLHPQRVQSVSQRSGRWLVEADSVEVLADEVLIATGHDSREAEPFSTHGHPRLVPSVFPVDQPGGLEVIPAGSTVAVRGFGLTSIDAALALTEGRGGAFEPMAEPGRFRYRPGPKEVAAMVPFSRTGRPMVPKPDGHHLPSSATLDDIWQSGADAMDQVARLDPPERRFDALVDALCAVADRALAAVNDGRTSSRACAGPERVRSHLGRLLNAPAKPLTGASLANAMERAVEVAFARQPADLDWALGAAWRGVYPAIVRLIGAQRLEVEGWRRFVVLAREMERIAFGPPAENAARYLALVKAGKIDLRFVAISRVAMPRVALPSVTVPRTASELSVIEVAAGGLTRRVDYLVNAVLAPPGGAPQSSPLLRRLLAIGHIRKMPWNAGISITENGQCIDRSGQPTPGLSMIGRPTEGAVLGNDTLSRKLHDLPERWAKACAQAWRQQREMVHQ